MTTLPDGQGDEQFVREHWERAEACPHRDNRQCCISLGGRMFTRVTVPNTVSGYAPSESEAWAAARVFTEARLEEIRQVEEEIEYLEDFAFGQPWKRILFREQAALAELKRGLKKKPAASQESEGRNGRV